MLWLVMLLVVSKNIATAGLTSLVSCSQNLHGYRNSPHGLLHSYCHAGGTEVVGYVLDKHRECTFILSTWRIWLAELYIHKQLKHSPMVAIMIFKTSYIYR